MATQLLSAPTQSAGRGRRSKFRRAGIFAVGAVLNVAGAAAWLLSVLLTAPLMLAGVWVWSREFGWAERLLHRVRAWVASLWQRVRTHPVRWAVMTVAGLAGTAALYWFLMG
jgi:hypothetical protein